MALEEYLRSTVEGVPDAGKDDRSAAARRQENDCGIQIRPRSPLRFREGGLGVRDCRRSVGPRSYGPKVAQRLPLI